MPNRIERLRQAALCPNISYEEFYLHFYRHIPHTEGALEMRVAQASAYAWEHTRVQIGEDELIVGRAVDDLSENERAEWEVLKQGIVKEWDAGGTMDSHMSVDYALLLRKGASGLIADIDASISQTDDPAKITFYRACQTELGGMVRFAKRYAQEARLQAAVCTNPQRRQELVQIAAVCEHVPEYPARTFYEAVQATHFLAFCLTFGPLRWHSWRQFQLGHIDRFLLPYYEADKAAGTLTDEQAQELIDCLAILINHRKPTGASGGYMVGGHDEHGQLVLNPLTWMGLKAIEDVHLVFPAVGLCWTHDAPDELLDYACQILSHGRSHPAIFNDDLIAEGLMYHGVPMQEAHSYIHSNCVEITPDGASNCWVAPPYVNTAQLLLDVLPQEPASFEALFAAWRNRVDEVIRRDFAAQVAHREVRRKKGASPLLSWLGLNKAARLGIQAGFPEEKPLDRALLAELVCKIPTKVPITIQ